MRVQVCVQATRSRYQRVEELCVLEGLARVCGNLVILSWTRMMYLRTWLATRKAAKEGTALVICLQNMSFAVTNTVTSCTVRYAIFKTRDEMKQGTDLPCSATSTSPICNFIPLSLAIPFSQVNVLLGEADLGLEEGLEGESDK